MVVLKGFTRGAKTQGSVSALAGTKDRRKTERKLKEKTSQEKEKVENLKRPWTWKVGELQSLGNVYAADNGRETDSRGIVEQENCTGTQFPFLK